MNPYAIEQQPDEPIVFARLSETFSISADMENFNGDIKAVLDSLEETIYYIVDVCDVRVSLQDAILGANTAARGTGAYMHHPNIMGVVVVTQSKLLGLASKGLSSDVFGNVPVSVSETMEDALAYARTRIAAG